MAQWISKTKYNNFDVTSSFFNKLTFIGFWWLIFSHLRLSDGIFEEVWQNQTASHEHKNEPPVQYRRRKNQLMMNFWIVECTIKSWMIECEVFIKTCNQLFLHVHISQLQFTFFLHGELQFWGAEKLHQSWRYSAHG